MLPPESAPDKSRVSGGRGENTSPPQVLKLMDGPEDQPENDNDFVDFAETFLSSEPFSERPQETGPQEAQQGTLGIAGISYVMSHHTPLQI